MCVFVSCVQVVIKEKVLELLLYFTKHEDEEVKTKAIIGLGKNNTLELNIIKLENEQVNLFVALKMLKMFLARMIKGVGCCSLVTVFIRKPEMSMQLSQQVKVFSGSCIANWLLKVFAVGCSLPSGFLVIMHPSQMFVPEVKSLYNGILADASSSINLKIQILKNLQTYLQEEDTRMQEADRECK